jgi:hypothetical protein
VTDTGRTAELLDLAQRAWPDVTDRKELLLRLAQAGADSVGQQLRDRASNREQRRAALLRSRGLLDPDLLVADQAWD